MVQAIKLIKKAFLEIISRGTSFINLDQSFIQGLSKIRQFLLRNPWPRVRPIKSSKTLSLSKNIAKENAVVGDGE